MKTKWGNPNKIITGGVYRSTNGKFIKIEAVNETHYRYMIIQCSRKRGRSNKFTPGAVFVAKRSNITNYIGPIEFTLSIDWSEW
jgi:hypothetical protein